jgi:purine-binding chemotaxis protein CheW
MALRPYKSILMFHHSSVFPFKRHTNNFAILPSKRRKCSGMSAEKPPIDWEAIWKSLDWDDEERRQRFDRERLRYRAQLYAAPPRKPAEAVEAGLTVLAFDLGSEQYGIDVMQVRGVRALPKIARVPGTPDFYRGVVNLRGQILTVLDLRLFLRLSIQDESKTPRELIVVRANHLELGFLADNVRGVVNVPNADIEVRSDSHYILGVTTSRLALLNTSRIFEDDRLIIGRESDE